MGGGAEIRSRKRWKEKMTWGKAYIKTCHLDPNMFLQMCNSKKLLHSMYLTKKHGQPFKMGWPRRPLRTLVSRLQPTGSKVQGSQRADYVSR